MVVSRSKILLRSCSSFPLRSFIDGVFVPPTSDKTYDLYDAATGLKRLESHWASTCQVQDALNSTTEAQYDWMTNYSIQDRIRIFHTISNQLQRDANLIAQMESMDTGRTISETSSYDAISASQVLTHYINLLEEHPLTTQTSSSSSSSSSSWSCIRREPLGVTVGIGTWNYPIMNALMKSIPSLAFGNGMIYKPSELTPTSALYLAQLYREAGIPPGLFNVVLGDKHIVQSLITNHVVEKISFTGSVPVGTQIYQSAAAASHLKQVHLELGGKSPLIVCEDADIDMAVQIAMLANWYSNGQVCSNGTRVFVPSSKQDEFLEKLMTRTSQLKIGHPLDPSTDIGPMISQSHLDRVYHSIHTIGCQQDKATLVLGGQKLYQGGYYMSPAILSHCQDDMQIVQEEIFGMVLCVLTYDSEEEVIHRANQTKFGLAAGIVTNNTDHALTHMIPKLQAGVTWINTYNEAPMHLPWSGWKQSGIGTENGTTFAIDSWTRPKSVLLPTK